MKVLLVCSIPSVRILSGASSTRLVVHKKAGSPPLGLLTVAAMLPPDWESRLVDLNVQGLRDEDLAWADIAFVSAMIIQRDAARAAIQRCKQAGLKVVAGDLLHRGKRTVF